MNARGVTDPRPRVRFLSGWTPAVVAFVVAVAVLAGAYGGAVRSLVGAWLHDGTYQYAILVFPLGIWVAWSLRGRLAAAPPVPSVWGLVAVALLVGVWYVGHALAVNLPQHAALVAMFPALVLACWGWRALRVLQFPLAYVVVFATPWGNALVGPLQDITARLAVHALHLAAIPVLLEGREIITPSAVWMVEEACSGVKFFMACMALGSLYAYLMYARPWKRLLFTVLAAVVPILANGLRVYFTIVIGESWGLEYATGTDHLVFGWQFFGAVLLALFLAGWFFRDAPAEDGPAGPGMMHIAPGRAPVWALVPVLLLAGPLLASRGGRPTAAPMADLVAPAVPGWRGPHPAETGWAPSFRGAAGQFLAAYRQAAGDTPVELFHAVYTGRPRRGHDLVTYGNDVYAPDRMRVLSSRTRDVRLRDGSRIAARELWLAGAGGRRLVLYWYCVERHCTSSPVRTKLWQAWRVLRGSAVRSSVWAVSLPMSRSDDGAARESLVALARMLPVAAASSRTAPRAAVAREGRP